MTRTYLEDYRYAIEHSMLQVGRRVVTVDQVLVLAADLMEQEHRYRRSTLGVIAEACGTILHRHGWGNRKVQAPILEEMACHVVGTHLGLRPLLSSRGLPRWNLAIVDWDDSPRMTTARVVNALREAAKPVAAFWGEVVPPALYEPCPRKQWWDFQHYRDNPMCEELLWSEEGAGVRRMPDRANEGAKPTSEQP